jgi:hypothetical protein
MKEFQENFQNSYFRSREGQLIKIKLYTKQHSRGWGGRGSIVQGHPGLQSRETLSQKKKKR